MKAGAVAKATTFEFETAHSNRERPALSAGTQISFDSIHRVPTSRFDDFPHARRIRSLARASLGAIQSASLTVSLIGRDADGAAQRL